MSEKRRDYSGHTPPKEESLMIGEQAGPAMIEIYRDLFWRIAEAAERDLPGEAMKRAYKLRDALATTHAPLPVIGTPRDREAATLVTTSERLTFALWRALGEYVAAHPEAGCR